MSPSAASPGLARTLVARPVGVASIACAGQEMRQTGRRDLIGAWLRPNSAVSADRSSVTSSEEETVDMVILGADLHKRWHTVVAV